MSAYPCAVKENAHVARFFGMCLVPKDLYGKIAPFVSAPHPYPAYCAREGGSDRCELSAQRPQQRLSVIKQNVETTIMLSHLAPFMLCRALKVFDMHVCIPL